MAVYRCTLTYRNVALGVFSQNVIHLEDSSNIKSPEQIRDALQQEFWGLSGAPRLSLISSLNVQWTSLSLQRVDSNPTGGTIPLGATLISGSQGSGVLYPTVGFCFTLLDGGSGPRHRGRLYHSATPANLLNNGIPTSVAVTNFQTLRDQWLNAFGPLPTTGLHWVLWHRDLQGDARWTRIVDIRLSPFARCQRRRNFGTGF